MKIVLKWREIATTLVCLTSLLPFIKVFPTYTFEIITMGLASLYLFVPSLRRIGSTKGVIILLFFIIWVVCTIGGINVPRISYYSSMYVFMIMAYSFTNGSNSLNAPLFIIKFAGFLSAFATFVFWASSDLYFFYVKAIHPDYADTLIQGYDAGNLAGLYNHYSKNGMVLAIALGVFFVQFLTDKERKTKKTRIILFIFILMALLFTGKRGPVIFAIACILICYRLFIGKNMTYNKTFKFFSILVTAVALFFVVSSFIPQLGRIFDRFEESNAAGDITLGRAWLYAQAFELFKQNPVLGNGWFSFTSLVGASGGGAHNIYLQLLCEVGVVGFLFFVIMFVYLIVNTIKLYRKGEKLNACNWWLTRKMLLISIYIQIFFVLYGFTGNPLYDRMMLCPYFIAIAIYVYYRYNDRSELNAVINQRNKYRIWS